MEGQLSRLKGGSEASEVATRPNNEPSMRPRPEETAAEDCKEGIGTESNESARFPVARFCCVANRLFHAARFPSAILRCSSILAHRSMRTDACPLSPPASLSFAHAAPSMHTGPKFDSKHSKTNCPR
jgi:hypothetical protein